MSALSVAVRRLQYLMIFKLYGEDLHNIQALYEKHKDQPPIPRNMTRIAGNIHWSRQLLRRITSPMKKFQVHTRSPHCSCAHACSNLGKLSE